MRERELQKKCIEYLKHHDIYYINKYGDGRSAKGCPDLLCCINGKFVAFELKVGNGKMKPDQRIHKLRIEREQLQCYHSFSILLRKKRYVSVGIEEPLIKNAIFKNLFK